MDHEHNTRLNGQRHTWISNLIKIDTCENESI